MSQKFELSQPITPTCPNCGGSMRETAEGSPQSHACKFGHGFNVADMDPSELERMWNAVAIAFRTLNERAELCRRMAKVSKAGGQTYSSERWEKSWREAEHRAGVLRRFLDKSSICE